jgi:D-alanyl-D-alanine carboxypeptidase/D-alanyl-D-alanine-endopeptidase (penicillin-binding protein 4)
VVTDPVSRLEGLDGASLSVLATEVEGDVLTSHDPDRALAPASNTKLVTAALALDALGPDHRFGTRVEGHGELGGDHLRGDLVLVGSGAPDLGVEDLAELAHGVGAEVTEIRGDLVLDGSRFGDEQLGPGWTWGDEQQYYGARSSALALEENLVRVEVIAQEPGKSGDSPAIEVSVTPDTEVVAVETDVEIRERSDGGQESDDGRDSDDDLRVFTDHETGAVRIEGSLPPGATRTGRAPVVRPEGHCGAAFHDALAEAGVEVTGEIRVGAAPEGESAFSLGVESASVADLLREMNVPSDNFVAEQLARGVAAERDDGTWDAWSKAATDFLESCGAGPCRIRDGSGLSRYTLLTAEGIVALLERVQQEPWSEAFFDSLPAPGEGTLENRLADVPAVRAKTGTITGSSALSGVIRREYQSDVVFSVIFGGLTVGADEARRRQDEFVRALV